MISLKQERRLEIIGASIAESIAHKLGDGFKVVPHSKEPLEWKILQCGIHYGGFCFDKDEVWMQICPDVYSTSLQLQRRLRTAVWTAIGEVTSREVAA